MERMPVVKWVYQKCNPATGAEERFAKVAGIDKRGRSYNFTGYIKTEYIRVDGACTENKRRYMTTYSTLNMGAGVATAQRDLKRKRVGGLKYFNTVEEAKRWVEHCFQIRWNETHRK